MAAQAPSRFRFLEEGRLRWPELDPVLLLIVVILPLVGVVAVTSASMPEVGSDTSLFGAATARHIAITGLGFAMAVVFSLIDYRRLRKLATPGFAVAIALLVAVLFVGSGENTNRWIVMEGLKFQFQPSEVAKPAVAVFLAYGASVLGARVRSLKWFAAGAAAAGVPVLLVVKEPDLGTALIIALTALVIGIVAGAKGRHLLLLIPLGLALVGISLRANPYQLERVDLHFLPGADSQGSGYQSVQAIMALGSGGIAGKGLGMGTLKYLYLPTPHTDSVFAVIGEEFGLLGTGFLVLAFLVLLVRGLWVAHRAPDTFGRCLAAGITLQVTMQAYVNMGVVAGIFPVTGLPLPFVSSGGSSLLVTLAMMGVLINVARAGRLRREA